jgi:hypothetical protein
VIVGVEPVGVGRGAVLVAAVGLGVGPFGVDGAVEALDLAVGLGPVGPGPAMFDVVAERFGEGLGPVAGAVVGHDCGDADAGCGEEGVGPEPERRGGLLAFIAELFGVGEATVVVERVVQVDVST